MHIWTKNDNDNKQMDFAAPALTQMPSSPDGLL